MAITNTLNFNQRQLRAFARLFREARLRANMSQLAVAQAAFDYRKSHCKVSRVERCAMPKVDAHCLERMAEVLHVPQRQLEAVDPMFKQRAAVAREATRRGFWVHTAAHLQAQA